MPRRTGITFWLAVAWLFVVALLAATAQWLPLPPPDRIDWTHLAAVPGTGGHLLGTDEMGRDIASRLVYGSRVSLCVGLLSPGIGLILGGALGIAAGFYRGPGESVIVWIVDVLLAFPRLIFLMMAMAAFGSNLASLTLALGLVCLPSFARVGRAQTLRFAQREFVVAARAAGAGDRWLILGEILPNVLGPLLVFMILLVGVVIVAEGMLGFLGMGVPPPTPSWGGMISQGREVLDQAPHVSMIPTATMFLTILSLNLVADRLGDPDAAEEPR